MRNDSESSHASDGDSATNAAFSGIPTAARAAVVPVSPVATVNESCCSRNGSVSFRRNTIICAISLRCKNVEDRGVCAEMSINRMGIIGECLFWGYKQ